MDRWNNRQAREHCSGNLAMNFKDNVTEGRFDSRIGLLWKDRERRPRREAVTVLITCGAEAAYSRTHQAALLTAFALSERCFPGSVRLSAPEAVLTAPVHAWAPYNPRMEKALADVSLGHERFEARDFAPDRTIYEIVIGSAEPLVPQRALRASFAGWAAGVGPISDMERATEGDCCPTAGLLASALAVSEIFLEFSGSAPAAMQRNVYLSLWDPGVTGPDALTAGIGPPLEALPDAMWLLGLGHLGQAYAWALSLLPYNPGGQPCLHLLDFDSVEPPNVETGLIVTRSHAANRTLKTRAVAAWLESRGFQTRLVERRIDQKFHVTEEEPGIAVCGVDSNAVRRYLPFGGFQRVLDCGLGGRADNFDSIALRRWPNPRSAEELWPDDEEDAEQIKTGPVCGFRGAIAVPFVGTISAASVVGEILRSLHQGKQHDALRLRLRAPNARICLRATEDQLWPFGSRSAAT